MAWHLGCPLWDQLWDQVCLGMVGVWKVGSEIQVRRDCGADWAEEKPEGKEMLLMLLRRGAGAAEVEGWSILCPGGSSWRFMGMTLCPQRQDCEGKQGLFLWLWKASGGWKHSSIHLFFVSFHVSYKPSSKPLFSYSIPSFAVGMAKPFLLFHFPLICRELKLKNW